MRRTMERGSTQGKPATARGTARTRNHTLEILRIPRTTPQASIAQKTSAPQLPWNIHKDTGQEVADKQGYLNELEKN